VGLSSLENEHRERISPTNSRFGNVSAVAACVEECLIRYFPALADIPSTNEVPSTSAMATTGPTREEFLDHIHEPLTTPHGDPPKGSPTKSTPRYRWRTLHHWDVEGDANAYWDGLPEDAKFSNLQVGSGYWDSIESLLIDSFQPRDSEHTLRLPFSVAYRLPLNRAIQGASDAHAEVWDEGSRLQQSPIGNPDFIFVHDGKLMGVIELKTWWKLLRRKSRKSKLVNPFDTTLMEGRERLDGDHHGRLGIE
jgi:hypothetical protein